MSKALIAMSGGVDSSVAAFMCVERGLDCTGATMKLYDKENNVCSENGCCTEDDIADARAVATRLDMPFHVFNFTDDFDTEVIARFIDAYEKGATPNPCVDCNRYIKFERFFRKMQELNFDYIVTGHYARIEKSGERYLLKKAVDASKDQSYVLYSLTQEQLSHTLFPLGELKKEETRLIAEEKGFINAKKRDSQDICFVPDGDYAAFIEGYTGKKYPCGDFVDKCGNKLGSHCGIIRYTIGQRKGLGLALPAPMYVCEKDIVNNKVILCSNEELFSTTLTASNFNWIAFDSPPKSFKADAKIRYNQAAQPATVTANDDGTVTVTFDTPQRAIAKGQAVVLYDGDTVIGGGTIN
ncbi:MAG: tRNA 2-thiouridine(34) synthase MnmA [Clostridia bacterium]|nr:tRNA 2-thiouridine(34) synthase MnmA [Clostridia bacterium]